MNIVKPLTYVPVSGFPGYRAGSDGTIWKWFMGSRRGNRPYWRVLKGYIDPLLGYVHARLRRNGKAETVLWHLVILRSFRGECPPGMECCHRDDDKKNNRIENLRWDTPKANSADAKVNGKTPLGETHGMAKLSEGDIQHIRKSARTKTNVQWAKEYSVTPPLIGMIIKRKVWRHI